MTWPPAGESLKGATPSSRSDILPVQCLTLHDGCAGLTVPISHAKAGLKLQNLNCHILPSIHPYSLELLDLHFEKLEKGLSGFSLFWKATQEPGAARAILHPALLPGDPEAALCNTLQHLALAMRRVVEFFLGPPQAAACSWLLDCVRAGAPNPPYRHLHPPSARPHHFPLDQRSHHVSDLCREEAEPA